MTSAYDSAVTALYRAPLSSFVSERKRLAAELKSAGDAAGSARLLKLGRPTLSAWAVNQLWWHAREQFDELLASAQRLREGDLAATAAHRRALQELRVGAAALLGDAGHAANEATLRRVTTTLSALAASGGFEPDPAGALQRDRDPPGFEALGIGGAPLVPTDDDEAPPSSEKRPKAASKSVADQASRKREPTSAAAEKRRLAEQEKAERQRLAEERKAKQAERQRVEAALRNARREIQAKRRDVAARSEELERQRRALEALERELTEARRELEQAERESEELEAALSALEQP